MAMVEKEKERTREEEEYEEEESTACPSFRSLSATAHNPSFFSSSSSDGDDRPPVSGIEFEFPPLVAGNRLAERQLYPVFGEEKDLKVAEECDSESESDADDLEGVPPDSYCVWRPGEKVVKKCSSVGSGFSRRWSFRHLVIGRSRSDGKERFHLPPAAEEETKKKGKGTVDGGRIDEVYRKDGDRRRTSFLPYRRDLLGPFPAWRSLRPFF